MTYESGRVVKQLLPILRHCPSISLEGMLNHKIPVKIHKDLNPVPPPPALQCTVSQT